MGESKMPFEPHLFNNHWSYLTCPRESYVFNSYAYVLRTKYTLIAMLFRTLFKQKEKESGVGASYYIKIIYV